MGGYIRGRNKSSEGIKEDEVVEDDLAYLRPQKMPTRTKTLQGNVLYAAEMVTTGGRGEKN